MTLSFFYEKEPFFYIRKMESPFFEEKMDICSWKEFVVPYARKLVEWRSTLLIKMLPVYLARSDNIYFGSHVMISAENGVIWSWGNCCCSVYAQFCDSTKINILHGIACELDRSIYTFCHASLKINFTWSYDAIFFKTWSLEVFYKRMESPVFWKKKGVIWSWNNFFCSVHLKSRILMCRMTVYFSSVYWSHSVAINLNCFF